MNPPCRWKIRRPGVLIPVFFLSCLSAGGQFHGGEAIVAATGNSYTSRIGFSAASMNQAGLGWVRRTSVSMHHQMPFVTGEVSVSSLAVQFPVSRGAFGVSLSGYGIRGLRYNTAWIAYGTELHPDVSAGAGIHFRAASIPGEVFYRLGAGCAMGFQFRIGDEVMAGAHVMLPACWSSGQGRRGTGDMTIAAGISRTFFQSATLHAEVHIRSGETIRAGAGLEAMIAECVRLCAGFRHSPLSLACGAEVRLRSWTVQIAGEYVLDTGNTPYATLAYTF